MWFRSLLNCSSKLGSDNVLRLSCTITIPPKYEMRDRTRRDITDNPAQFSLVRDAESEASEELCLTSRRDQGQTWATREGLLTLGQCCFHFKVSPSSQELFGCCHIRCFSLQAAGFNPLCSLAGEMGTCLQGLISRTSGNLSLPLPGPASLHSPANHCCQKLYHKRQATLYLDVICP